MHRVVRVLTVALAVTALLAACGGDDDDDDAAAGSATTEASAEDATTTTGAPDASSSDRGQELCVFTVEDVGAILETEVATDVSFNDAAKADVCRYSPTSGERLPTAVVFAKEDLDCSDAGRTDYAERVTGVDIEAYVSDFNDAQLLVCGAGGPFELAVEAEEDQYEFSKSAVLALLELVARDQ
jgi:hypothetical protein